MASEISNQQKLIDPKVKKFTDELAVVLSTPESIQAFAEKNSIKMLSQVMIAADYLLEPNGNFVLVNTDMTLKEFIGQ